LNTVMLLYGARLLVSRLLVLLALDTVMRLYGDVLLVSRLFVLHALNTPDETCSGTCAGGCVHQCMSNSLLCPRSCTAHPSL